MQVHLPPTKTPHEARTSRPTVQKTQAVAIDHMSLGEAWRVYAGHVNVHILGALLCSAVVARLFFGGLSWIDALLVGGIVAFQPLLEWLVHVLLLHWQPRWVLGVTVDFTVSRAHRRHHQDPWHLPTVFIPARTLWQSAVLVVIAWTVLLPGWALPWTAIATTATLGLFYEWLHFLSHTTYRPHSKPLKRIFRYHRLHHFKNENYWLGVTMHQADRLLRTLPSARDVPTSRTARNLGGMSTGDPPTT